MITMKRKPITRDGVVAINNDYQSTASAILVTGNATTAILEVVAYNTAGTQYSLIDRDNATPAVLVIGSQEVIDHGVGKLIYLKVSGLAPGTELILEAHPIT